MTEILKRCIHCNSVYSYQGFGEGCFHPNNNKEYCNNCMGEINKVLSNIPVKYEKCWVESDLPYSEFIAAREKRLKMAVPFERKLKIGVGRIIIPKDGNRHDSEQISYETINYKQYCYIEWEHGYEPSRVEVAMNKNIETGEIEGYWLDL